MTKDLTKDVEVIVKPRFEESLSEPRNNKYLFSYQVLIENNGLSAIQLLSRQWFIFDSSGQYKEVQGEGVVGEQPIIEAGSSHHYQSFCQLTTDMGMMWGSFWVKSSVTDHPIEIKIPEFHLIMPCRLN